LTCTKNGKNLSPKKLGYLHGNGSVNVPSFDGYITLEFSKI
jgi:hypothetical protein